jgi:hypothetical protein
MHFGTLLLFAVSLSASGCKVDTPLASDDAGGPTVDAGLTIGDGGAAMCGSRPCECSNGMDDDADGQVDGFDAECTTPFDDDEASFATDIVGDVRDRRCQDCFFDGNSGTGDDGCRISTSCSTEGAPSGGGCDTCDATVVYRDNCLNRTPNGCDCYGCCTIHRPGIDPFAVFLVPTCSLATIDDPELCPRCMQRPDCLNPCGPCELCAGRTAVDLPAECTEFECQDGQRCDPVDSACPAGQTCQLGCCLETLI